MFTTKKRAVNASLRLLKSLKVKAIQYKDGTTKSIEDFKTFEAAMKNCFKHKAKLIY